MGGRFTAEAGNKNLMIRDVRERNEAFWIPVLLSLLIHMLIFIGVSLDVLWPKGVSAKKPLPIRIVSVVQPKPKKRLPPNPNSRFLSDANRRESGAGRPSDNPRLRREKEDRVPARQGTQYPAVASLALPTSPPDLPQPSPPPPVIPNTVPNPNQPKRETASPKPQVKEASPPEPQVEEKRLPVAKEAQAPRPEPRKREKSGPTLQAKPKAKVSPPKSIQKVLPAPAERKSAAVEKLVQKEVKKRSERPKPAKRQAVRKSPEVRVTRKREKPKRPELLKKKPVEKKPVRKKMEKSRPAQKERKKPIEVASLPKQHQKFQATPPEKIQPRPKINRAPRPPVDVLAMFRAQPTPKGRLDAPKLKLSDEDADRIAIASLNKDLEEEAGESISMNTRDVRYASYMDHIKRKIYSVWYWPEEAKGYTGKLRLKFVIQKDGTLAGWKLLDSSGYRILDDEVIAAVTKAAPFNPFPPSFKKNVIAVDGLFVYEGARGFWSR